MVVGMLVVFAGLVILVWAIGLLKRLSAQKKNESEAAQKAPIIPTPDVTTEAAEDVPVAVIAAAVAAVMDTAPGGFVVRSIRRVQGVPAWNRAGREEQIYGRL